MATKVRKVDGYSWYCDYFYPTKAEALKKAISLRNDKNVGGARIFKVKGGYEVGWRHTWHR
jgi:hypothetical protein